METNYPLIMEENKGFFKGKSYAAEKRRTQRKQMGGMES